jgi:hypothetical protein
MTVGNMGGVVGGCLRRLVITEVIVEGIEQNTALGWQYP